MNDYEGILQQLMQPRQGILSDPQSALLSTLGAGLLSQSGPSRMPVRFGQALGNAAMPAMQAQQQAEEQRQRQLALIAEMKRRQALDAEQKRMNDAQIGNYESQALLRAAQEEQRRAAMARQEAADQQKQQSMQQLKGVLSMPTEEQALAQMREMDARGEQGSVRAQTPEAVRRASLAFDPTGAQLGRINQTQRPTVLTPGSGLVRPGEMQPSYTQPFRPNQEPAVYGAPTAMQGPGGPQMVQPSNRPGIAPRPMEGFAPMDKPKPTLPPAALRIQQEELEEIGIASSISSDLSSIKTQIDSGQLNLSLVRNLEGQARNFVGLSTPNSRNYASFKATLEKLRNDSLRLNKGVQTEGDAVRAWNELLSSINDEGVVKQRLDEIQRINERAVQLRKLKIDTLRNNFGAGQMDTSSYETQAPAVGSGARSRQDILKEYGVIR